MGSFLNNIHQLGLARKILACSSNYLNSSFFTQRLKNVRVQSQNCPKSPLLNSIAMSLERCFSNHAPVTNDLNEFATNILSDIRLQESKENEINESDDLDEEQEVVREEEPTYFKEGQQEEVFNMLLYEGCGDVKYSQWNAAYLSELRSTHSYSPADVEPTKSFSYIICPNCGEVDHNEADCSKRKAAKAMKRDKKVSKSEEPKLKKREQSSSLRVEKRKDGGEKIRIKDEIGMDSDVFKHQGSKALPTQAEAIKIARMRSRNPSQTTLRPESRKDTCNNKAHESTSQRSSQSQPASKQYKSPQKKSKKKSDRRNLPLNTSQAPIDVPNTSNEREKNREALTFNQNLRPTKIEKNSTGPKKCYNCGGVGHFAKSCSAPKKIYDKRYENIGRSKNMKE